MSKHFILILISLMFSLKSFSGVFIQYDEIHEGKKISEGKLYYDNLRFRKETADSIIITNLRNKNVLTCHKSTMKCQKTKNVSSLLMLSSQLNSKMKTLGMVNIKNTGKVSTLLGHKCKVVLQSGSVTDKVSYVQKDCYLPLDKAYESYCQRASKEIPDLEKRKRELDRCKQGISIYSKNVTTTKLVKNQKFTIKKVPRKIKKYKIEDSMFYLPQNLGFSFETGPGKKSDELIVSKSSKKGIKASAFTKLLGICLSKIKESSQVKVASCIEYYQNGKEDDTQVIRKNCLKVGKLSGMLVSWSSKSSCPKENRISSCKVDYPSPGEISFSEGASSRPLDKIIYGYSFMPGIANNKRMMRQQKEMLRRECMDDTQDNTFTHEKAKTIRKFLFN